MLSVAPTSVLGVVGVWGLFGAVLIGLFKALPALKKIQTDGDASLREDLLARVVNLEKRIDVERALHDAEMGVVRHRLGNESSSIDALLGLLKSGADISPETIERIERNREEQAKRFAAEMNTIMAARLAAVSPKEG